MTIKTRKIPKGQFHILTGDIWITKLGVLNLIDHARVDDVQKDEDDTWQEHMESLATQYRDAADMCDIIATILDGTHDGWIEGMIANIDTGVRDGILADLKDGHAGKDTRRKGSGN